MNMRRTAVNSTLRPCPARSRLAETQHHLTPVGRQIDGGFRKKTRTARNMSILIAIDMREHRSSFLPVNRY